MAKWGEIKCPRCEELEVNLNMSIKTLEAMKLFRYEQERWLEETEAKLEKVVALALEECPFREGTPSYNNWSYNRRTTLAKLTGDTP